LTDGEEDVRAGLFMRMRNSHISSLLILVKSRVKIGTFWSTPFLALALQ
jgi:hypothetical protein